MANIIDDTEAISIGIIIEGDLEILNLSFPSDVHIGEAFTITYSVHNLTEADTFWGALYDASDVLVPGSDWVQTIGTGGSLSRIIYFNNGISSPFAGTLRVGHVE